MFSETAKYEEEVPSVNVSRHSSVDSMYQSSERFLDPRRVLDSDTMHALADIHCNEFGNRVYQMLGVRPEDLNE